MKTSVWPLVGLHFVVASCSDDTRSAEGTFGSATAVGSASSVGSASASASASESAESVSSVGSEAASDSDSAESTMDSGELTTGAGSQPSTADGTGVSEATAEGDDGIRFDTPVGTSATTVGDGGNGTCNCGSTDWSYVWIANTEESTVSKINTRTLVEEGRYITRPDKAGSPSRTSVSIDGKAVVVANRHTGIVKIWARPEFCKGGNTSSGRDDVQAWGTDDCVAWYTEFPDGTVQRPVAWTSGALNPSACRYENQKVWTTTGANDAPGACNGGGVRVHRLNGDTGVVEDEIPIPDNVFHCDTYGPYGGAVDYRGNFWFHGSGQLARVDFASLDYEVISTDFNRYGITVDTKGRVWLSNPISRYDYATKSWVGLVMSNSGGIAQDLQGRVWAASSTGLSWVDMETTALGGNLPLPGPFGSVVKGVSVDIDGFIWAVYYLDTKAYKIDPNTFTYEIYDGLNAPYTYSDMTGGQINNVECNPPEG